MISISLLLPGLWGSEIHVFQPESGRHTLLHDLILDVSTLPGQTKNGVRNTTYVNFITHSVSGQLPLSH